MTSKPSTTFASWIKAHSARIASESTEFQHLVTSVSFYLDMIEMNPKGLSAAAADSAVLMFRNMDAAIEERGMEPPAIDLPKIKVVRAPQH